MYESTTQERLRHEAGILDSLPIMSCVADLMREAADELDHLKKAASLPQYERSDYIAGHHAGFEAGRTYPLENK